METEAVSNTPQRTSADMLCMAASISMLLGLGSFALMLTIGLLRLESSSPTASLVLYLSFIGVLLFLLIGAPFIGLFSILDVATNRHRYANPGDGPYNRTQIHRTARSFLVASLLYALACLSCIVFVISEGMLVPGMLTIWFVSMILLVLLTGCISLMLFANASSPGKARVGTVCAIIAGLLAVGAILWTTVLGNYVQQSMEYSRTIETFSGKSDSLERTAIVPTLNSLCPQNKNVVWCSSFQLTWNRMRDGVIGEPVEVIGAEELAARLNKAKQSAADMEADSFYAAAGRVKQGIIDTIRKEMSAKFPSHSVPDFNDIAESAEAIVAYSYLTANVPFKYPFRQVKREFAFTDSNGVETNVGAFGAWGLGSRYRRMREQVEILYVHEDREATDRDLEMKEFAIDLCKHSEPYQVVAAVVEPKDSLAQTLDYVRGKVADSRQEERYEQMSLLDYVDILTVPEMFWEVDHRFEELIGKTVANANPAMPIIEARQAIKFRLDRYGAVLESEASIAVSAIPRCFRFNRPFLVYMKKRDCEQPFFVMWVDNAELLNRK